MNLTKHFTSLVLILCTAACAATSHQRVPLPAQDVTVTRADLARIYFVREENTGLRTSEIQVFDGETEIGALTSDTFLCWERPSGRTLARAFYKAKDPSLGKIDGVGDLDCKAGRAYYFDVSVRKADGKPVIEALSSEKGQALVAKRHWAGAH
jgi:hypothetical protein